MIKKYIDEKMTRAEILQLVKYELTNYKKFEQKIFLYVLYYIC